MIERGLLERALIHHGTVARHLLNGTVIGFLAMIAIAVSQGGQQKDSQSQNQ